MPDIFAHAIILSFVTIIMILGLSAEQIIRSPFINREQKILRIIALIGIPPVGFMIHTEFPPNRP